MRRQLLASWFSVLALGALATRLIAGGPPVAWSSLNGPAGGIASCITLDPGRDHLLAGVTFGNGYNNGNGAIFRSTDHGDTWSRLTVTLTGVPSTNIQVRSIVVSPAGVTYAGYLNSGVYRSIDGGDHWTAFTTGLPNAAVRDLVIAPGLASGEVFVCCNNAGAGGVFQLNPAATGWLSVSAGLPATDTTVLAAGTGYLLVVSASTGIHKRSLPAGAWSPANTGLPVGTFINDLVVAPTGEIYACTDAGLYISSNAAASWSPVAGPFAAARVPACAVSGAALLVASSAGLFRTIDGSNWSLISAPEGFTAINARCFALDGPRLFVGSSELGFYRSLDSGATFASVNSGVVAQSVRRLVVASTGAIFAGTQDSGIHRSTTLGATWDPPRLTPYGIFALAESPWGDLFAGNYTITGGIPNGHAWRSTDAGDTWLPLDNGLSAAMVSGFAFPGPQQVLCSAAWNPGGISTSSTNGNAWTRLGPPVNIPAYCLGRSPEGDLYFGSEGLGVWRLGAGATTWENKGFTASQQFTIGFNSRGHVFFGNDGRINGLYRSVDRGASFQPLTGYPSQYGYWITALPSDHLYAASKDQGVQRSTDGGDTWEPVNTGLPTSTIYALALGPDGHLYAGTAGWGIYRTVDRVYCAADFNADGATSVQDLFDFLAAYFTSDPRADINRSGSVTVQDIFDFLAAYFAGCL